MNFDYQHAELVINNVDKCLPWGLDNFPGSGFGFFINVWDGESIKSNLHLYRKGKSEVHQHAILFHVTFKYLCLVWVDTIHGGAMVSRL